MTAGPATTERTGGSGLSGLMLVGAATAAPTVPEPAELVASDRPPEAVTTMAPPSPLAKASVPQLVAAAYALRPVETDRARRRRADSTSTLLGWLSGFAGQDWPTRWESSGAEARGRDWCPRTGPARGQMTGGLAVLLCLRVLRPGYRWLLGERFLGLWRLFGEVNDPAEFARLGELASEYEDQPRIEALHALIRVMVHTGKPIATLEVTDLLAYADVVTATKRPNGMHIGWLLLRRLGVLDATTPPTLHVARSRGQLSVAEVVDGYAPASRAVRDVFVRYLTDRSASLDYASLRVLASRLVGVFWREVERLAPGIDTLRLGPVLASSWKQTMRTMGSGGRNRIEVDAVLMSVRGFYADLAQWALTEPEVWAQWAVPSPVSDADLGGYAKRVRHRQARMHQRTRTLAPVLPALTAATEARLNSAQDLLAGALGVDEGDQFSLAGRSYRRLRRSRAGPGGTSRPYRRVRVADDDGDGIVLDVTTEEADAFWAWAIVECCARPASASRRCSSSPT